MHQHQPVAPPTAMDSIPRRWVLKPLSPLLQPSDLRTIHSPPGRQEPSVADPVQSFNSVPVNGNHFSEFDEELKSPSSPSSPSSPCSPCSSSSGSHAGFYSFVEDPASPEAEQNQAWMVSPQRGAQLLTLKEESGFTLRTYTSSRKPESLFSDGPEDSVYQDRVQVVGEEEEKQLRQEIIRSQAPKKNPVLTEELQILENLDLTRSPNKLSYSPVRPVRPDPPTPVDPGDIVKEQINFSAARKQFLQMEPDQVAALLDPRRSSKPPPRSPWLLESEVLMSQRVVAQRVRSVGEDEDEVDGRTSEDQTEESLSGQGSGPEELIFAAGVNAYKDNSERDNSDDETTPETPIEREIRLVQEREEDLRRSRGLRTNDSRDEMIEIKIKRLQPWTPTKTKDRTRVTSVGQREILQQKQDAAEPEQTRIWTLNDRKSERKSETELQDRDHSGDLLSPSCPHRHPVLRESTTEPRPLWSPGTVTDAGPFHQVDKTPSAFPWSSGSSVTHNKPHRWSENPNSSGLQSTGQGAPDFIEKEIKEALRREKELRESRERSRSSSTVYRETKMAAGLFYSPIHGGNNS